MKKMKIVFELPPREAAALARAIARNHLAFDNEDEDAGEDEDDEEEEDEEAEEEEEGDEE
jgi:ribosomal protein L12E/L44/L45/RPP1/RPP2